MSVRSQQHIKVAKLDHELVDRRDVKTSRPALEAAGFRCESCRRDDALRVAAGYGQLVVLCPECRLHGGFRMVLTARRQRKLAPEVPAQGFFPSQKHSSPPAPPVDP